MLRKILRGGSIKIIAGEASLVGGHTIEDNKPKFGLVVLEFVNPDKIIRKKDAQSGDVLVLTQPLGTGIVTNWIDRVLVATETITAVTRLMTNINRKSSKTLRG